MADATWELDAVGGNKVVAEADKAEKAMNKVGRASSKGGMAVLEFSRGMEDYAMAGMKGVMNNIPGFLQNIGVGMGLTGVISVATIAVWKGVEALEAYMNHLHDVRMSAAELSVKAFNLDAFAIEFKKEAIKRAKELDPVLASIADSYGYIHKINQAEAMISAKRDELDIANELLWLSVTGASAEEKRIAEKKSATKSAEDEAKAVEKTLKTSEAHLLVLKNTKKALQEDVANRPVADTEKLRRAAQIFVVKENKRLRALTKLQTTTTQDAFGTTTSKTNVVPKYNPEEALAQAQKNAQAYYDMISKEEMESIKERSKTALIAEEKLKGLQKSIDEQEKSVLNAKIDLEFANKKLEVEKKLLETKELQAKVDDRAAKAKEKEKERIKRVEEEAKRYFKEWKQHVEDRERLQKAMMDERVPDPSLSSQGRAGLSGKETQAALGMIGIARQQLTQLKTIARNTRNFSTTYA